MGIFGDQTNGGAGFTIEDIIRGTLFQMSADADQVVKLITARLFSNDAAAKVKFAIYDNLKNLIGATGEETVEQVGSIYWHEIEIIGQPALTPNAFYFLVAWSDRLTNLHYGWNGSYDLYKDSEIYNGYPNPANLVIDLASFVHNIYCTYGNPVISDKKKIPNYFNSDFIPCDA